MIKPLINLSLFFLIASCSSYNNMRQIKEDKYDGLRFESFNRYDLVRLDKQVKLQNPVALCQRAEYNDANDIFKDRLDKNLNNYDYWNQISTCYILKKEYTQAKKFLDIAMSTAKTKVHKSLILNNIGVVQLETENYQEAKDYFKKAIALNKAALSPRYNLSQVFMKFGLYNKAQEQIKTLLKRNAQDIDFLNSYAHIELMQNRYKQALVFFNKIPKAYRSRDDIATNMAMTYFMLGLYDNAKSTLNNADKEDSFYSAAQVDILKKLDKATGK